MKTCRAPQLLKSDGCKKRVDRSTIAWRANLLTLRTAYETNWSGLTFGSPPFGWVDRHAFTGRANTLTLRASNTTCRSGGTFRGPPKLRVERLTLARSAQTLTRWTEFHTHRLIGFDTVWRPVVVLQYNNKHVYCWRRQRYRRQTMKQRSSSPLVAWLCYYIIIVIVLLYYNIIIIIIIIILIYYYFIGTRQKIGKYEHENHRLLLQNPCNDKNRCIIGETNRWLMMLSIFMYTQFNSSPRWQTDISCNVFCETWNMTDSQIF